MLQDRLSTDSGAVGGPKELDVKQFFEDLSTSSPGGREVAKQRLQSVFGSSDEPSPRAAPWVQSGEWDEKELCVLFKVTTVGLDKICSARVGTQTPSNSPSALHFCTTAAIGLGGTCTAAAHTSAAQMNIKPGYYISTAGQHRSTAPQKGVELTPRLDLGPLFNPAVDLALLSIDTLAFSLTGGQWKYIFGETTLFRNQEADVLSRSKGEEAARSPVDPSLGDLMEQIALFLSL